MPSMEAGEATFAIQSLIHLFLVKDEPILGLYDAITNRKDHVEIIMYNIILFTIVGSSSEFPNNWLFVQFAFFQNMLNVLRNVRFARVIESDDLFLG